jgi:hypothetical protein
MPRHTVPSVARFRMFVVSTSLMTVSPRFGPANSESDERMLLIMNISGSGVGPRARYGTTANAIEATVAHATAEPLEKCL